MSTTTGEINALAALLGKPEPYVQRVAVRVLYELVTQIRSGGNVTIEYPNGDVSVLVIDGAEIATLKLAGGIE